MSTDLAEQTRVTLENVAKVLEAAGTSLEHVVTVGVFLYVGRRMNPNRRSLTLGESPAKVGSLVPTKEAGLAPPIGGSPGMKCSRCQQDNPTHARFCLGCGAHLAVACGSCGAELPGAPASASSAVKP